MLFVDFGIEEADELGAFRNGDYTIGVFILRRVSAWTSMKAGSELFQRLSNNKDNTFLISHFFLFDNARKKTEYRRKKN